ncbi:hypothetical protein [Dyadobacter helix]|uniref:hypothetical protein n=1 Tax=Dyadobacter helix TaxID=2822344 RepID=UPI001BFC0F41|nr:hypothetical protein [Dyadobacter sp. CECT 9275]
MVSIKRVGENTELLTSFVNPIATFDAIIGGDQVYEVKVTDANGNVSTSTFNLDCTRPDDCQDGPILLGILEHDANGMTYKFHGNGVFQIDRKVYLNGVVIESASGVDFPASAEVNVSFSSPLAAGSYVLAIRGKSCWSEPTTLGFTITDNIILAWSLGYPAYDYSELLGKFRILASISRAGTYRLLIKDASDDSIKHDEDHIFSPGGILYINNFDPGEYDIDLGGGLLTGSLNILDLPEDCDTGPEDLIVSTVTKNQLVYRWHGINVFTLRHWIELDGVIVVAPIFVDPTGAVLTINYPTLSPGDYDLKVQGVSCYSEVATLPFTIEAETLAIQTIVPELLTNGRYKLKITFSGGKPLYMFHVRQLTNNTIGTYGNVTGSPTEITLPSGILPQTIKVKVIDSLGAEDEENVVLPSADISLKMIQWVNYFTGSTSTPMSANGVTYPIGDSADFHWDIEATLPNGGLWLYGEKKIEKYVSGVWVQKDLAAATGQPVGLDVTSGTTTISLLSPRNSQVVTIDGQNIFKTAGRWRATFIFRKNSANSEIVKQITIDFTISVPATLSGMLLHSRNGGTLGASIAEIPSYGGSYPKPTPQWDITVDNFNGVQFDNLLYYIRQKVNNAWETRYVSSKTYGSLQTTVSDSSLFRDANFSTVHVSILANVVQDWQIEIVARVGSGTVASRMAEFTLNLAETAFLNDGLIRRSAGGKDFCIVNGMDFGIEVLSSGNIRLFHPATRSSFNGQNTVYPWRYIDHVRIPFKTGLDPEDINDEFVYLEDLVSPTGVPWAKGSYSIAILWFDNNVDSYDDVLSGGNLPWAYNLAGPGNENHASHAAMPDYIYFSII